jgi:glycosyltransferase involved in cell wall biosynthesis
MTVKYVVITPVRDEQANLDFTIQSMIRQSVRPTEWIIVNDGSSDKTGSVIDEAAAAHTWLHPVHRTNRGFRKSGGGVVEAFNDGYRALQCEDWEFIVKLDGDLSFAPDYFERCFEYFVQNPNLGVAGGSIYNIIDRKLVLESCPGFHVRGATKIYRRACWETLGGLMSAPGWDTLDEVKAQMQRWDTRTFPDLALTHHRLTGAADGAWGGVVKNGRANYICGYHPLFMAAKCIVRLIRQPYVMGSVALAYGFLSGYIKGIPQVNDSALIRYLRGEQLSRLIGRKSIWR